MNQSVHISKWIFSTIGGIVLAYCLVILTFITTCPDIQLRILLTDSKPKAVGTPNGVEIQKTLLTPASELSTDIDTSDIEYYGEKPEVGDRLIRVGNLATPTFPDFTRSLIALRSHQSFVPLKVQSDPAELDIDGSLGPFVEFVKENNEVRRFVRIELWREGWSEPRTAWLGVKPMPFVPIAMSLVWFVLQMCVFFVAGFAYWNRPFEHSARLFFLMSTVTLGAFIGGFHWWVIAGSIFLNVPFIICATLLPAVALHFFLIYPEPKQFWTRMGNFSTISIYVIPVFTAIVLSYHVIQAGRLVGSTDPSAPAVITKSMYQLRFAINMALIYATLYFAGCVYALLSSTFRPLNPIEKNQVQWMLWAAIFSVIPIGYTVYLAYFDRVEFALGNSRLPMFATSLVFLFAYSIGIMRYRLMLVDQMVSKGMLFYVLGYGSTFIYSVIIAIASLIAASQGISLSNRAIPVTVILVLIILVLMWFRDRIQGLIDRNFFREKYKLDQALHRMNIAVGELVNRRLLASRMLSTCKEVLRVEQAALYMQSGDENSFQLIASLKKGSLPKEYLAHPEFLNALLQGASLQRTTVSSLGEMNAVQRSIRELDAYLVHALELDGQVAGLLVIGAKNKNAPYTAEDVTFLHALGQITGVALHCVKVQQDVQHLNEDLQNKVDKIQDQRRQIAVLQQQISLGITAEEISSLPADQQPLPRLSFQSGGIIGSSPAMAAVMETVGKVAPSESSVLIRGESGTGKELLARAIHENSTRRSAPLVSVHCAALSDNLLESELFGHEKGAFTGAHKTRVGRFELANGGTLFLDEIGDISLNTQVKLLRVLQEKKFEPVGSSRVIEVNVRLVAATHQNLEQLIQQGKFREDLYYRLNVISLNLPPLRERREDILELAGYFLHRGAQQQGQAVREFSSEALQALEHYHWPGNIRELQNAIESAIVLSNNAVIELQCLPREVQSVGKTVVASNKVSLRKPSLLPQATITQPAQDHKENPAWEKMATERIATGRTTQVISKAASQEEERRSLEEALIQSGGNKAEAARILGIPRSTFYSRLKKHAIK